MFISIPKIRVTIAHRKQVPPKTPPANAIEVQRAQSDGVVDDGGPTNSVTRIARRIGTQKIAETESPDNLHNAWEKGE